MLRTESKARARALQLLYAWEVQGRPPFRQVADGVLTLYGARGRVWPLALDYAEEIARQAGRLDALFGEDVARWRMERIGVVERNILRLAAHELERGDVPPAVVIDEAVRLARRFAGAKAPAFVNGVLDALAHRLGRL